MFIIKKYRGGKRYRVSLGVYFWAKNTGEISSILENDKWKPDHIKNNKDMIVLWRWEKEDITLEAEEVVHLSEMEPDN